MKTKILKHGGTARRQAEQLARCLKIDTERPGWLYILAGITKIPYATWRSWVSPGGDKISDGGVTKIQNCPAVKKAMIKREDWYKPEIEHAIPLRIDQAAVANRILELLDESEWQITALAASISRYLRKEIDQRLLGYHLRKGHVKRPWYRGIREYFGSLAWDIFQDERPEEKKEALRTDRWEGLPPDFLEIVYRMAADFAAAQRKLEEKVIALEARLHILETACNRTQAEKELHKMVKFIGDEY